MHNDEETGSDTYLFTGTDATQVNATKYTTTTDRRATTCIVQDDSNYYRGARKWVDTSDHLGIIKGNNMWEQDE